MHWAKTHERAQWELSGSNLLHCTLEDLPGWEAYLSLSGANDEGYAPLIDAIGAQYGISSDRVCTAAGASGAYFLALGATIGAGDEVLVEAPGYDPHTGAAELLGARVRRFDRRYEDGFAIEIERIKASLSGRTRLIVVSNPHNPSGVLASDAELLDLKALAEERNLVVLVDEVYLDSAPPRTRYAAQVSDRFISINSLTKSYGLSGLRIGWAVANPDLAGRMRRVRDVVDAVGSFPAEGLAVLAFKRLDALAARARSILQPNRSLIERFMGDHLELEWVPPTGGAVAFPRFRQATDTGPFVDMARARHGVGLVPGSFFGAPEHFRIALGGPHEILAGGLAALGRALAGWAPLH